MGNSSMPDPLFLCPHIKRKAVWPGNDATACGCLLDVRCWWNQLVSTGPDYAYGYFPNPSKTCLIVKPSHYGAAVSIFSGLGVLITAKGKHYLGAALGTAASFVSSFVNQKVLV